MALIVVYEAPDGSQVRYPTEEFLTKLSLSARSEDWTLGSGTSGLGTYDLEGERLVTREDPALVFFLVEQHGWLISYFDKGGTRWDTYDGSGSKPWVLHQTGGEPAYWPRACFVDRPMAARVFVHSLNHCERLPSIAWIAEGELELPESDEVPPEDLA